MTLPFLHLVGSEYEKGLQHGRQLRAAIAHNLDVYFHRFQHESGLDRHAVLERAVRYGAAILQQNPVYYRGMEGIAEGSGSSFEEIAALNVRYEIIYYQAMAIAVAEARDGCTSFAVSPGITANGHLLLGQNWDWIPGVKGALLHTMEPDGLETLAFSEAGIVGGKIGFNSAGIGLAINGLSSTSDDWQRLSRPFHVRCYEILRQSTLSAAVGVVTRSGRACSANFLIAQAPDQAVNIEASPDSERITPLESHLVHANHFVAPAELGIEEPPYEKRHFSCNRHERMSQFIAGSRPVTIEAIERYLRDHTGRPGSICRHEDPEAPVGEQYRTVTSVIMDLTDLTMHASDGPPCQNEYQKVDLRMQQAA